jgi:hypothetical protein
MNSAREFCREGDYPIAVFLTYSFDPLFFERIPLADLRAGGSRRIVVAADAGQVAEAMRRCIGQTVHLGRRYLLAETVQINTFHPKLIARLSRNGGRVWLGSGNLTYTGWGGNHELGTSWPIGPGEADPGGWLDDVLTAVGAMVRSTSFADQLRAIRAEAPWLTARSDKPTPAPVLFGMPARSLAPQLAQRWQGRRFDHARICTGSTDTDGAFLDWARRTFGITQATICLTPAQASFDPARLSRLPLDIRIVEAPAKKTMHAKFYWFHGDQGPAAVVGSANCSAAAWLGSNVELIVPYDHPDESAFASALEMFGNPGSPPAEALEGIPLRNGPDEGDVAPLYRLVSLRLAPGRVIEAVIDPRPDPSAHITMHLEEGAKRVAVRVAPQPRAFAGRLPLEFSLGSATAYGFAEVVAGGLAERTEPRWVDNDAALDRNSTVHTLDDALRDFGRNGSFSGDRQHILETIRKVSAQLLSGAASPAPPTSHSHASHSAPAGDAQDATAPAPLDPAAMIRSLQDITRERQQRTGGRALSHAGTLRGVMALLFAREAEPEDIDLGREAWGASEPDKNPDQGDTDPPSPSSGQSSTEPSTAETLASFRQQLRIFLSELAKPSFAETCVPTRMVEALAYPLFLCLSATDAGWLPAGELSATATRVTEIMLDQSYGQGKPRGLLHMARQRHETAGSLEEFNQAAGNGTLWTVLLAALTPDPNAPPVILLPQAAALSGVLQCQELLARTDPSRLSSLVQTVLVKNADSHIVERAPRIADAMSSLTGVLSARWDALYRGSRLQPARTLLWSRVSGWHVTPASPAQTYCSAVIRFESALASDRQVRQAFDQVVNACR